MQFSSTRRQRATRLHSYAALFNAVQFRGGKPFLRPAATVPAEAFTVTATIGCCIKSRRPLTRNFVPKAASRGHALMFPGIRAERWRVNALPPGFQV